MDFATDAGECAELPARDNEQGSHKLSLERPLGSNKEGSVLGEALYWMAEKLTWGMKTSNRTQSRRLSSSGSQLTWFLGRADQDRRAPATRQGHGARSERGPQKLPRGGEGREFRGASILGEAVVSQLPIGEGE
jgi:hypothetical protein